MCRECGTKEVDEQIRLVFGILVCKKCMREKPDTYSLLTKTEVKEVRIMHLRSNTSDVSLILIFDSIRTIF